MVSIGHAMAFETWRSLTEPGLSDAEAADLMVGLVGNIDGGIDATATS
jgi:hypothetical protein